MDKIAEFLIITGGILFFGLFIIGAIWIIVLSFKQGGIGIFFGLFIISMLLTLTGIVLNNISQNK